jgi:hypothetical protein
MTAKTGSQWKLSRIDGDGHGRLSATALQRVLAPSPVATLQLEREAVSGWFQVKGSMQPEVVPVANVVYTLRSRPQRTP